VAGGISEASNTAIALNGSTGYISSPDHADFDTGDVFTLEAWIRKAADGSFMCIVNRGTTTWYMRMSNTNKLELVKDNVSIIVESTATITGTGWHHVVATKDGATVKLYIDKVDVTGTVTNATMTDTNDAFHVGRRVFSATEFFNGGIDEVAVYPTALSATRVAAHYDAGIAGSGISIFIVQIQAFCTDIAVADFLPFARVSARGAPGSTVTPDIDNHFDRRFAPISGAVVDLAAYTVSPGAVSGIPLGMLKRGILAIGSGAALQWEGRVEVLAGQGLSLYDTAGGNRNASALAFVWDE